MNTDKNENKQVKKKQSRELEAVLKDTEGMYSILPSVIHTLKKVELNTVDAKLNETSITDDNGKRINLVEEPKDLKK